MKPTFCYEVHVGVVETNCLAKTHTHTHILPSFDFLLTRAASHTYMYIKWKAWQLQVNITDWDVQTDANLDIYATTAKPAFTAGAIPVFLASVFLACHQTFQALQFTFSYIPKPLPYLPCILGAEFLLSYTKPTKQLKVAILCVTWAACHTRSLA